MRDGQMTYGRLLAIKHESLVCLPRNLRFHFELVEQRRHGEPNDSLCRIVANVANLRDMEPKLGNGVFRRARCYTTRIKYMGFIAKHGDPTSTGGVVFAFNDFASNQGMSIALHGDHATCGICGSGSWPIYGSCENMRFHGRAAVQHGDLVLCPCGKNRVIATAENMHYDHRDGGQGNAADGGVALSPREPKTSNDQQFQLLDAEGNPMANIKYKIVTASGVVTQGFTDVRGMTTRVATSSAETLHLYIVS